MVKEYLDKHNIGLHFGHYRLLRLIKRGAFATICEGMHVHLEQRVTVKVFHSWRASDAFLKRFWVEARLHASMHHPNIIRVLDFGINGQTPFLVMDYADRGTLQNYFVPGQPMAAITIWPFVQSIASALQYVHCQHIIHRDIKPQNILLGPANEVWLSDFGIAIASQPWSQQTVQESIGTALYASPEQICGHPVMASDQYSLAVLIYEWLCGRPPFVGSSAQLCQQHLYCEIPRLRRYVPMISVELEKVVLKALAKDPYQRFSSIREFARALQEATLAHPGEPSFVASQNMSLSWLNTQYLCF